jgi:phage-related minor tail protein
VIAIKAQVKATADNAAATDRANRESSSLVNVQKINASLIGITRDRADAIFAIERNAKMKEFGLTEDMLKANTAGYENQIQEIEAMMEQHARQMENPIQTMARSWNDMGENIRQASTQWMTGFSDQLTTMLINGKADFASFTKAVLADIARIMVQKMLIGLGTAAMGFLGGGGGGSTYGVTNTSFSTLADGGIMSSMGKLPLNKYASGGVAKSPQVAIFGEGRQNEAYVPLPDGKSIPVTMKGGGGAGDNNVSININVDGGGNATQDKKGGKGDADMWGKMADSIKGIVVQTISEQRRPGGQLWAG